MSTQEPTEYGKIAEFAAMSDEGPTYKYIEGIEPSYKAVVQKLNSFIGVKTIGCYKVVSELLPNIDLVNLNVKVYDMRRANGYDLGMISNYSVLPLEVLSEVVDLKKRFAAWQEGRGL